MIASVDYSAVFSRVSAPYGTKRVPELDGVRGLAIAFVIIFHCLSVNIAGHKALLYLLLPTRQMWSGVDLFFVLSGLLIGGILLDRKSSPSYYSTFYARRICRIFPLYYLMVSAAILGGLIFPHLMLFRASIPSWTYLLFAQNLTGQSFIQASPWLGVTWSLAIEEQFYLLLPLVVRFCSQKTLARFVIVCILGAPLLRSILTALGATQDQTHALLPCRADALALGVAVALIIRNDSATAWVRRNRQFLYGCMLLLAITLPALLKWQSFTYLNAVAYTFFDLMYSLLLLLLLTAPITPLSAFFRFPILRWLGAISFCAYLIHSPIQQGLLLFLGLGLDTTIRSFQTLAANLCAVALTLLIAQTSWLVLERPLTQRAHFRYKYA